MRCARLALEQIAAGRDLHRRFLDDCAAAARGRALGADRLALVARRAHRLDLDCLGAGWARAAVDRNDRRALGRADAVERGARRASVGEELRFRRQRHARRTRRRRDTGRQLALRALEDGAILTAAGTQRGSGGVDEIREILAHRRRLRFAAGTAVVLRAGEKRRTIRTSVRVSRDRPGCLLRAIPARLRRRARLGQAFASVFGARRTTARRLARRDELLPRAARWRRIARDLWTRTRGDGGGRLGRACGARRGRFAVVFGRRRVYNSRQCCRGRRCRRRRSANCTCCIGRELRARQRQQRNNGTWQRKNHLFRKNSW